MEQFQEAELRTWDEVSASPGVVTTMIATVTPGRWYAEVRMAGEVVEILGSTPEGSATSYGSVEEWMAANPALPPAPAPEAATPPMALAAELEAEQAWVMRQAPAGRDSGWYRAQGRASGLRRGADLVRERLAEAEADREQLKRERDGAIVRAAGYITALERLADVAARFEDKAGVGAGAALRAELVGEIRAARTALGGARDAG